MKVRQLKILSVFLVFVMLFTSASPAFAATPLESWKAYWETADAQAGIVMFPGADDSQRNFSWYTDENAEASAGPEPDQWKPWSCPHRRGWG